MEENQKVENEELMTMGEVFSLDEYNNRTNTDVKIYTTLKDKKQIFNLEEQCDYKLNDCEGMTIVVKDMLCKVIKKDLEEPFINEETGEMKDKEYKMITILIDENNKSYVTASKTFFYKFMKYCKMFPNDFVEGNAILKIKKVATKNSSNKSLSFDLI